MSEWLTYLMMDSLTSVLMTRKAEYMQLGQVTRKPLNAEAVIEMLNVNMSFNMIELFLVIVRRDQMQQTLETSDGGYPAQPCVSYHNVSPEPVWSLL